MTIPSIPTTLHELLAQALHDLELCEADPQYEINMDVWHHPDEFGRPTQVCLAGAFAAKTLGIPPNERIPWGILTASSRQRRALNAINNIRMHLCFSAAELLDKTLTSDTYAAIQQHHPVPAYKDNPEGFKRKLAYIAAEFKRAGI